MHKKEDILIATNLVQWSKIDFLHIMIPKEQWAATKCDKVESDKGIKLLLHVFDVYMFFLW